MTRNDARWERPRSALPWPAIAIADTARGLSALDFALALGEAAHELHVPVHLRLLDFEREPALPSALAPRFAAVARVSAQRVEGDVAVTVDASALELWVGLPALVALQPALGILLGIDRPRLEWPSLLRGVQPQLGLAATRPGLAAALLQELKRRGFLPGGEHSVR
ncbi:MAG TPA: hypothetical protein VFX59_20835 [Polyangiales bacterium]|nr:hypothetical protein [Polyangiales bacterium]